MKKRAMQIKTLNLFYKKPISLLLCAKKQPIRAKSINKNYILLYYILKDSDIFILNEDRFQFVLSFVDRRRSLTPRMKIKMKSFSVIFVIALILIQLIGADITKGKADTTIPVTDIILPVNNSYINGEYKVIGTASDIKLSNWVLDYGLGTSPLIWTEICAGNESISNGTIGIWDTAGLSDGTEYALRLRGQDEYGNENQVIKYITKDATNPVTDMIIASNAYVAGIIKITGIAFDEHLTSWTFEYGQGTSPKTWVKINNGTTSITDDILGSLDTSTLPDGTFTIRVSAIDEAQNTKSTSQLIHIDNKAPSMPENLTCAKKSEKAIHLKWTASSDNFNVTGYTIYRDGISIGNSKGTTYVDTTCYPGQTHVYIIRAEDAAGNISDSSKPISVNTPS